MSLYRTVFRQRHALLPVIHVASREQALRNAAVARSAACDGIFLINHGIPFQSLLAIHHAVIQECPDWWVGVNCLDLHPSEVFQHLAAEVAGVWVDNAEIDEQGAQQGRAEAIQAARSESGWQGLYFGGVAFKYQRPVEELEQAARLAARYMHVVTTSGPGTGIAALREKIARMKAALGNFPLAIASGITPENITDYLDVADCFLVATGISRDFWELDPTRVQALVEAVSSYSPAQPRQAAARPVGSVCFVCEWNEGRSVHLELSARRRLREQGSSVRVMSAGLSPGGGINSLRREFLLRTGVPRQEMDSHRSTPFSPAHAQADLILVAELPMKARLLASRPELRGRVMTVRGFLMGFSPESEALTEAEAHIEDAGGHTPEEKLALYRELESLAAQIAARLLAGAPHAGRAPL